LTSFLICSDTLLRKDQSYSWGHSRLCERGASFTFLGSEYSEYDSVIAYMLTSKASLNYYKTAPDSLWL